MNRRDHRDTKIQCNNRNSLDDIKHELKNILELEIDKRLSGILELFNLTSKDDVEILYKDDIFDAIASIPKEGEINKIPILGIKILDKSDFGRIQELRRVLWNKNNIPISLFITPTDIILNNNYSVQKTQKSLNSLHKHGKFDFGLLKYDNLINGKYIDACERFIKFSDRVDQKLLRNIRASLKLLLSKGTSFNKAHNILSKSIFIKYLEDRKILTINTFKKFKVNNYCEALKSDNIELLFKYLEEKFNGNIFYTKEDLPLKVYEINTILDFLSGTDLESGQLSFCGYDFSIIPIELISNIYELFLLEENVIEKKEKGAFYTPYFLANAIVENINERILRQNYKILDPSCGSGVFLVSSFKKLVALYKSYTHSDLINLLKNCIYGVDINEQALKITKLSLYIALLDCFNPKDIEKNQIQFPDLSNNLLLSDYFNNDLLKNIKFDLVIGNPPWSSVSTIACENYIKDNYNSVISDSQLCQSFIVRTKDFLSENGIASILISNGILYNSLAVKFRKCILNVFSVIEILNLQKLRAGLFQNAKYPCSVITFKLKNNDITICDYVNVEKDFINAIQNKICFDKSNAQQIGIRIMKKYDYIWKILHEGSSLDFELINFVKENCANLELYLKENDLNISQGCSVGKKENNKFINMKYVDSDNFTNFQINYNVLPQNTLNSFERSHNEKQYVCKNKILIKRSIRNKQPESAFIDKVLFYKNDFYSIFSEEKVDELLFLEGILNSDFYNYYQFHMSPSYNKTSQPEIRLDSIKDFPIPNYNKTLFNKIVNTVKDIHTITNGCTIEELQNKEKQQVSIFHDNYQTMEVYKNLVFVLNKYINQLYNLRDLDISIIDFTLKYLLKSKKFTNLSSNSYKQYYKMLDSLLKDFIPYNYNVYKSYEDSKFFRILFFEITKKATPSNVSQIVNLILKTYEYSSVNEIFNKVALRKNFIGTFKDGLFIIKSKKDINWQTAIAYLDFKKIEKLLLIGGNND
ncbi:MAG: N-6 DNA methylase [Clostridia bacterium]